jgi:Tfp pilus assembly protein PilO
MKISRREKILLLVAVYLLIIFGGYKLMVAPTCAKLAEVKATNSQIDQAVQSAVQGGKQKDESESVISKELASYMKLEEQLPRDRQLVELVDRIGTIASDNQVTLLSVNYTDSKARTVEQKVADQANGKEGQASVTGASKMDLTLSITGSYYHLLGFLQDLGRSPRIIVVNTVAMSVGQKEEPKAAGSAGTTYTSSNPPPAVPIAKGTRIQTSASTGGSVPVQNTVRVPEMTKYDLSNTQMNLQITSFYDSTQEELEKLLGTSLFNKLTGEETVQDKDQLQDVQKPEE